MATSEIIFGELGGSSQTWDETGSATMTNANVTVTLAKKPLFVYGEIVISGTNIYQYFFVNIFDEYTVGANQSCFILRPDYNTYAKGSGYVAYDGDKTLTFKYGNWGESGKTLNWVAKYAE